MQPDLADAVLDLAREMRECVESGEYPGACVPLALRAYGRAARLAALGLGGEEERNLLGGVHTGCVEAARAYPVDPVRSCERLRRESQRMAALVAEAGRCREECGV